MRCLSAIFILLLSLPTFGQVDTNLKTIIKDNGDIDREKVDSKKLCEEVRIEQQRLLVATRPEFKGVVTLKEAVPLEVFRADSSLGYAAKCILKVPSK